MCVVILRIANTVVRKTLFPDQKLTSNFSLGTEGEAAFDAPKRFLQRDKWIWRENQMEMVVHHDELVQQEPSLNAILLKNVQKKKRHLVSFENEASCVGHGGDEKSAFFLRSGHWPGLEAR